jgi:hypothetical protein
MAAPEVIGEIFTEERPRLELVHDSADLPTVGFRVLDRDQIGKAHSLPEGGTEHRFLYHFSNGDSSYEPTYEVRLSEPASRSPHERAFMSTVPWLTGLDGHHESLTEEAAANNLISVAIGREKVSVLRAMQQMGHIAMSQDAEMMLLVHNDLAKRGLFRKKELTGTGYSLAAIVLNGIAAHAEKYNTKLVHGEALDPGPARILRPSEIHPGNLLIDSGMEVAEISSIILQAIANNHSPKEIDRLRKTFPVSTNQAWQNLNFLIALAASGEGGRLASHVPIDTSINMTFFKHFRFNQRDEYRRIFDKHPNVRIEEEAGRHFTGARARYRLLMVGRTSLIQRELDAGTPIDEIDHKEIDGYVRTKIRNDQSLLGL